MTDIGATVLMGGGIDSAACAHLLQARGHAVGGVFINYGQAAAAHERRAVEALTNRLQVPLAVHGVTNTAGFSSGELIGRNGFLIFAAVFLSRCHAGLLAIGVHAGTPYYDCSPSFIDAMSRLVAEHTDGTVSLVAPFLHWNKAEVFDYFATSGLPLEATYSCEVGGEHPCGLCASCRDRRAIGC